MSNDKNIFKISKSKLSELLAEAFKAGNTSYFELCDGTCEEIIEKFIENQKEETKEENSFDKSKQESNSTLRFGSSTYSDFMNYYNSWGNIPSSSIYGHTFETMGSLSSGSLISTNMINNDYLNSIIYGSSRRNLQNAPISPITSLHDPQNNSEAEE